MQRPVLNRRQVRQVDRLAVEQYGMSGLVLMENAGRSVADALVRRGIEGPVVVCCGKGNNAGDGFVIARHLDLRGHQVKVLLFAHADNLQGDAAENYHILSKTDVPIVVFGDGCDESRLTQELRGADWIVESLLGTGAVGDPRPPLDAVLAQLNRHGARKLAVDLPSGLDCDTGRAAPCAFVADVTCTFVAAKPGFFVPAAEAYVGQLEVLDIGAPRKLIDEMLRQ